MEKRITSRCNSSKFHQFPKVGVPRVSHPAGMTMRILGIDPGLNITGYGCVDISDDTGSDPALVEGGVIRLDSGASMPDRLGQLHRELTGVIELLKPQRMVVEQLFSHYKHVRTAILMGHARGVILLAAKEHGLELDEMTPTEVKKALTGNGHATKQQVQLAVMAQCGLTALPEPSDLADAIAIGLTAGRRIQGMVGVE